MKDKFIWYLPNFNKLVLTWYSLNSEEGRCAHVFGQWEYIGQL